jgi:hypothetical protein
MRWHYTAKSGEPGEGVHGALVPYPLTVFSGESGSGSGEGAGHGN